jgi:hypothetical protein
VDFRARLLKLKTRYSGARMYPLCGFFIDRFLAAFFCLPPGANNIEKSFRAAQCATLIDALRNSACAYEFF